MRSLLILILFSAVNIAMARSNADQKLPGASAPYFLANKGQIVDQNAQPRRDIDAVLSLGSLSVFIGKGALHYQFVRINNLNKLRANKLSAAEARPGEVFNKIPEAEYTVQRLDMELIDASKTALMQPESYLPYYENFYLAHTRSDSVIAFQKITYRNIYPNIDWVLYVNKDKLKYDFVVHEGGNPKDIRIRYEGASSQQLQRDGSLKIETPLGSITEDVPVAYEADTKKPVGCSFEKNKEEWKIRTELYSGPLVIDPGIDWVTYYGGAGMECSTAFEHIFPLHGGVAASNNVTSDLIGNVYMTGSTESLTHIATIGAHQQNLASTFDCLIVKISPSGSRLWGTYYGGEEREECVHAVTDTDNNLYIAGTTGSINGISLGNVHQPVKKAEREAYLSKFSTNGMLQWGTYFGGDGADGALALAIVNNKLFLGGITTSSTDIATPGVHRASLTNATGANAFIATFDENGQRLWGTYYAGEFVSSIAVNSQEEIFVTGNANSKTGIASPCINSADCVFDTSKGGWSDAFAAKFTSTGQMVWGTYLGGRDFEWGNSVVVDPSNNVYVLGIVMDDRTGDAVLSTPNAHQTNYGGGLKNIFLVKLNDKGQRLWGTYYGGGSMDLGIAITLDECSNVVMVGAVQSTGLSTDDTRPIEYQDALIARFDPEGKLIWARYFGGMGGAIKFSGTEEFGLGVNVDQKGNIIVGGYTDSKYGIATPGAFQQMNRNFGDYFLMRMKEVYITNTPDTIIVCGDSFDLPYRASDTFNGGNIFTVQLSDENGDFTMPVILSTVQDTVSGVISCSVPANYIPGAVYTIRVTGTEPKTTGACWKKVMFSKLPPKPTATSPVNYCVGDVADTLIAAAAPFHTILWYTQAQGGTASETVPTPSTAASGTFTWYVAQIDTAGVCGPSIRDSIVVNVYDVPVADFAVTPQQICLVDSVSVQYSGTHYPFSIYNWIFQSAVISSGDDQGPYTLRWPQAGTYTLSLQVDNNGCVSSIEEQEVTVNPLPETRIESADSIFCINDTFTLVPAGAIFYTWTTSLQTISQEDNRLTAFSSQAADVMLSGKNEFGCESKDTFSVRVEGCCDEFYIPDAFTPNNDGRNDMFAPITSSHFTILEFRIYNRWGQLLFDARNAGKKWDGSYGDKPVENGVYYYSVNAICDNGKRENVAGEVTVIR